MDLFDLTDSEKRKAWDSLAQRSSALGVDPWCSQSSWSLAVHAAFADPQSDPGGAFGLEHADGIATFGRLHTAEGASALVPLDRVWGFASPVVCRVGTETEVCEDLAATLIADPSWKICVLTGSELDGPMFNGLVNGFGRHLPLYAGETRTRCLASLDGGVDSYLARRTREHRRNLRQAQRQAVGLSYNIADDDPAEAIVERLHMVEARSWKGRDGSGIESPDMARLYKTLVYDLSHRKALRCVFLQQDGSDVGFILGGVLGSTYRGLQISFCEDVRARSVGNLLQWHEVKRSCEEGLHIYDLGMDIAYKRRWAEQLFETTAIVAMRR